jgi:hypothetical protein
MCRVRNSHTTEPWTTAFICFTLDDNCTDEDGKYIDKPFAVRMIQWQPYCVKTPFDPKTPVCSACKKTNRTRNFCRERHKHRQLPWCTVYVLLSPADSIDPATRVAPESTPLEDAADPEGKVAEDKKVETVKSEAEGDEKGAPEDKEERKPIKVADDGEDINDISESRTFLAKVSCHASSIHWLELAEFDPADQHAAMQGLVAPDGGHMGSARGPPMIPGQSMDPSYNHFAHAMGFAAQQHQMSLKKHQQYFFQMQQRTHQQYAAHQAQWQAQYSQQPDQSTPSTGAPAITAGEAAAQQSKNQQGQPGQPAPPYGQWPAAQQNPMAYHQQMYQIQMAQFQQAGGVIPPGAQGEGAPPVPPPAEYQHHPGHQQGDEMEPPSVHAEPEGGEENDNKRPRHV